MAGERTSCKQRSSGAPRAVPGRGALMEKHRLATQRRRAAPLGSPEYEAAAAEIAAIEIAIARLEEPKVPLPVKWRRPAS